MTRGARNADNEIVIHGHMEERGIRKVIVDRAPRERAHPVTEVMETRVRSASTRPCSIARFATLPSNAGAVEGVLSFVRGDLPFVALFGPSGWGKSHLLDEAAKFTRAYRLPGSEVRVANSWLRETSGYAQEPVLVLDQVQDALGKVRERQLLRHALEIRLRLGRPTLLALTAGESESPLNRILPRQRLQQFLLEKPTRHERQQIIRQIARNESVHLSDRLVTALARSLAGNGNSISGAIQRLGLLQSCWSSPEDELRALGTLKPHLSWRRGWDLRDHVYENVVHVLQKNGVQDQRWAQEVSIFFMLRSFGLSEADVGSYFGISTGEVHRHLRCATSQSHSACKTIYAECAQKLQHSLNEL